MRKAILFVLFAAVIAGVSCKKKNTCTAGSGGGLTLMVSPQHHGKLIFRQSGYRDTAYIKFNTQDAPANGVYDMVVAGEDGYSDVDVKGLKCGNYYVYATCYDASVQQRLKGGIPVMATESSGTLKVNVPVSE